MHPGTGEIVNRALRKLEKITGEERADGPHVEEKVGGSKQVAKRLRPCWGPKRRARARANEKSPSPTSRILCIKPKKKKVLWSHELTNDSCPASCTGCMRPAPRLTPYLPVSWFAC